MSLSVRKKYMNSSKTSPRRVEINQVSPYQSPPRKIRNNSSDKDASNLNANPNSIGKNYQRFNPVTSEKPNRVPPGSLMQPKILEKPQILKPNFPEMHQNLNANFKINKNIVTRINNLSIPEKDEIYRNLPNFEEEKAPLHENKDHEEFKIRTGSTIRHKKTISWNLQTTEESSFNKKISELEEKVRNLEIQIKSLTQEILLKDIKIESNEINFQKSREDQKNEIILLQNKIDSVTKNLQISHENNTSLCKILNEKELKIQELEQSFKLSKEKSKAKCCKLKMIQKELRKALEDSEFVKEIRGFEKIVETKTEDAKKICELTRDNDLLVVEKQIGFNGNPEIQNTLKCAADENTRLRSIIIMSKLFNS